MTTATEAAQTHRHSFVEDVLAILTGTFLTSLGLFLLRSGEAVTGGTAGLSLLLEYATGLPLEVLLILVNLPFFALAARRKGLDFTIRSLIAVGLVSAFSPLHTFAFAGVSLPPLYAILGGNLLAGVGLLIVFRHRASLGGFNIVALLAQERLGWRAGYVQMGLDVAVVVIAFAVVSWPTVLLSAAGAILLNIVLALNHRPGRYVGM